MPLGYTGNLKMPNTARRQVLADLGGQVAFHDLAVVEIHLYFQVVSSYLLQDVMGLFLQVQKKTRHVAVVDGLYQHVAPALGGLGSGPL